ncbi:MAG TPA: 50S ribosomal protein L7ae [Clostridiales bacterium]|nr:50S ribosomal protein L7ae [Clostridiales bacterium]
MTLMKKNPESQLETDPGSTATLAVWRLLGLAAKAGAVASGNQAIRQSLVRQQARLVLLAPDAAENTRQKMVRMCQNQKVTVLEFGSMAEISRWTGHESRAAAAILDPGFAGRLQQLISLVDSPAQDGRPFAE